MDHIELTDIYGNAIYVNPFVIENSLYIGFDEVGTISCTVIQVSETFMIPVNESPAEIFEKVSSYETAELTVVGAHV